MEIMESSNFLGDLVNGQDFLVFFLRFIFNVLVIYIIARQIYYRVKPNRSYLFTMVILNIIVFSVCNLINSVNLSIGVAFGIFAIFSILRYRTRALPIKEMTYIFISISVGIINALSSTAVSVVEILFTNATIIAFTLFLEKTWIRKESDKTVIYEKIENIKPENREKLLNDLKSRTGLDIHRVEIGRINFLRDTCRLRIYYYDSQ